MLWNYSHPLIFETNFNEVARACKAILDYSSEIILIDPLTYLLKTNYPGFQSDKPVLALDTLKKYSRMQQAELSGQDWQYFDDLIEMRKSMSETYFNSFSEQINNSKAILQDKSIRTSHKKYLEKEEGFSRTLLGIINELERQLTVRLKANEFEIPAFDWELIELYVRCRKRFEEKMELTKMKPDPNDQFDLFNLIYVSRHDLYWVEEQRWKTIIDEANMNHCRFEFKGNEMN